MIVIGKENNRLYEVYGMYWISEGYYYGLESGKYSEDGIEILRMSKCNIVESFLSNKFFFQNNATAIHEALYLDNLEYDLVEYEAKSCAEFKRRVSHKTMMRHKKNKEILDSFEGIEKKKEEYLMCEYGLTFDDLKELIEKMGL